MPPGHRLGPRPDGDLTYESYLRVPELCALQHCRSDPAHPDELLFIITHQAYELWFRLILHEAEGAVAALAGGDARGATHHLRRIIAIERLLVPQIHILETMTPVDFLGFRDHLNPASGFQSVQFREVEFVSGMKEARVLAEFEEDKVAHARLERRFREPGLAEGFRAFLRGRGLPQPEGDDAPSVSARVDGLVPIYQDPRAFPDLFDLAEALIEHDQQIQIWRYHHVRMVERMIGAKIGTGGSEGVPYLDRTLGKRGFPDLWAVRTRLVPPRRDGGDAA
jgi:tryptophan 2,3-dioxygenase